MTKEEQFDTEVTEVRTEMIKDGLHRIVRIGIPRALVEKKLAETLKEIQLTASVPGFRKGKVPIQILKKRIGVETSDSVLQELIRTEVNGHLDEQGDTILGRPIIHSAIAQDPSILCYTTIDYEIRPEYSVPDVSEFQLIRYRPHDKDTLLEEISKDFVHRNPERVEVEEGYKSRLGDWMSIDFSISAPGLATDGYVDYEVEFTVAETNYWLEAALNLKNLAVGDELVVDASLPDLGHNREEVGKPCQFIIKTRELYQQRTGQKTDRLAQQFGFESVAELDQFLLDKKLAEFEHSSLGLLKVQLLHQIQDSLTFEVPERTLETAMTNVASGLELNESELMDESEDDEEFLTRNEDTEEKLINPADEAISDTGSGSSVDWDSLDPKMVEKIRSLAARQARYGILVADYAHEKHIEVSREEIQRGWLDRLRYHYGLMGLEFDERDHDESIEDISEDIAETILSEILMEKVVAHLLDQVQNIVEETVSFNQIAETIKKWDAIIKPDLRLG